MITLKKQLFVASLFLCVCWALRTSEGDGPGEAEQKRASAEVEQKEAVARNPQGQVVPFPRRILTFGEAAGRVTRGQNPAAWSFARGLATGATVPLEKPIEVPLEQRIAQLPIDAQITIAQYAESDKYDLWKTLNTTAYALAFRDNGKYLVSLNKVMISKDFSIEVVTRSMNNGAIVKRFLLNLPVEETTDAAYRGKRGLNDFLLSADGTTIAAKNNQGTRVYVWSTVDGSRKKLISINNPDEQIKRLIQISSHGEVLVVEGKGLFIRLLPLNRDTNAFVDLALTHNNYPASFVCAFSPDNKTFLSAVGFTLTSLGFWSVDDGSYKDELELQDKLQAIFSVGVNDDNTILAVATGHEIMLVRNDKHAEDLKIISVITVPAALGVIKPGGKLLFSHDSKIIAIALPQSMLLYHVATGELLQKIDFKQYIYSFAWSPDNILAIGVFRGETKPGIALYKKSTAFHDALKEKQKIEELRAQRAAQQPSQISVSSGSGSSSSSSSTAVVQQPAITIHTQEPIEGSGGKNLNMDEPD